MNGNGRERKRRNENDQSIRTKRGYIKEKGDEINSISVSWQFHYRIIDFNTIIKHYQMSGETVKEEGTKKKVALITGITGQDGSYLAELLLSKVGLVDRIEM